jgi:hypothetical protein
MDYKELKRKEFLFEIINDTIDGMDIYNHNGSLWLIKTEESKWAIEFTKDKTLWYNYNLFKNLFKAISLDISENQKYVTEWFESRFLNMSKVKDCCDPFFDQDKYVEETIQSGVKISVFDDFEEIQSVKDTIQNGVKETKRTRLINLAATQMVEDTIQNGVRHTEVSMNNEFTTVEDTIQNGVKHTDCYDGRRSTKVEYTIKNGVKYTQGDQQPFHVDVEDTIQNGVKYTSELNDLQLIEVKDTIQNGVKHTEDGDWLDGDERIDDIIQEGVKETHEDTYHHKGRIGGVIRNGVKE